MLLRQTTIWSALACCLASIQPGARAQPVNQPFTFSQIPHGMPHVSHGIATWGDYDGDGDFDVFLCGLAETGIITSLYRNDGKVAASTSFNIDSMAVFSLLPDAFEAVVYGDAAWGDFDGDGDLDLVVQGSRTSQRPLDPVTLLYENSADGFRRVESAKFVGLHSGVLKWVDFDNDGDLDLLATGETVDGRRRSILYRNDRNGTFIEMDAGIVGIAYGDAAWADFDNDGDMDLAVAGVSDRGIVGGLYENTGGILTSISKGFEAVAFASLDWGDYDDDGDLDLLVIGATRAQLLLEGRSRLWRNDEGSFSEVSTDFSPSLAGSASWGDFDGDGDLDVFIVGAEEPTGRRTGRLYINNEASYVLKAYLVGAMFTSAEWGDLDGDGDLDLLATGVASSGPAVTSIYENRRQVKPILGTTPSNAQAQVEGTTVRLSWDRPAGVPSASFNLRVGTSPRTSDYLPSASNLVSGRRLIPRPGNAGSSGTWIVRNLASGIYYWSVQTLNGAYGASLFSAEGTFQVDVTSAGTNSDELPDVFRVHSNYPNPFSSATTLQVDMPFPGFLDLVIYDARGSEVVTLVRGQRTAGIHAIVWSGRDAAGRRVASGVYFYLARSDGRTDSGHMVVVR